MLAGMHRRDFLRALPAAAALTAPSAVAATDDRIRSRAFDYAGVRLRDSRWKRQVDGAREFYLNLSDDDILYGFRKRAGLRSPGKPLGGWCREDSATVFGQWLSGLARLYRATGDTAARDKAAVLMTEWAKTLPADGNSRMRHYTFDKLACGLLDMHLYASHPDAPRLLEKVTGHAMRSLDREPRTVTPSHDTQYYGLPQEWYTLAENQYRAWQATANPMYKDFAAVWHYPQYWDKFAEAARAADTSGVHAYSHVNTFSSAAMAYAVTGDPRYLRILRNFYQFMQNTQCYATGGYGPNERFVKPDDGSLGKALETRSDTFETLCGSWAGFKLSRYLMEFTGEAHYGDWIERLFYNGAGAALPLRPGGRNFYYSDYRTSGGIKTDYWENFTCCSGTYIQDMADYHNLIYYRDAAGIYVNLYVASTVEWGGVSLTQETGYPETETAAFTVSVPQAKRFALRFRVPGWSKDMSLVVNGGPSGVECRPGEWASIEREWRSGDRVEARIPLRLRYEPVDRQHPRRVAVVRGPVVMALEYNYHAPWFELPKAEADLAKWLAPDESPSVFRVSRPDGKPVRLKLRPFYAMAEDFPYLMYFDLDNPPYALW
jgi:DUF1680 family protein